MPNTANQQLPYPASSSVPNVPSDLQLLALAVEKKGVQVFASASDRSTRQTAPTEGMICWLQDVNRFDHYTGSAWAPLIESPGAFAAATFGLGQPGAVTLNTGASFARFQKLGRTVNLHVSFTITGTGSAGSRLEIAVVGAPVPRVADHFYGTFRYFDSGNTVFAGTASTHINGADLQLRGSITNNGDYFGITPSIAAAAGDTLQVWVQYETAT